MQAIASSIMRGFGCAAFFNLLEKGQDGAEVLSALVLKFFEKFASFSSDDWSPFENHELPEFQTIIQSMSCLERFFRCLALLLNLDISDAETVGWEGGNPISSVLYFSQYSGKLVFERAVRQSFNDSFFQALIQDVMKTAATSKTLLPKHDSFKALLGKPGHLSCEDLLTALSLLQDLKAGMRQGSLKTEEKKFVEKLVSFADFLLGEEPDVSSVHVKALMKALNQYQGMPGVLDTISSIEKYMTSHSGAMATQDLVAYLDHGVKSRTFECGELLKLLQPCDRTTVGRTLIQKMDEYILDILHVVGSKAIRWLCAHGFTIYNLQITSNNHVFSIQLQDKDIGPRT